MIAAVTPGGSDVFDSLRVPRTLLSSCQSTGLRLWARDFRPARGEQVFVVCGRERDDYSLGFADLRKDRLSHVLVENTQLETQLVAMQKGVPLGAVLRHRP
jgi:hypothetical protein